MLQRAKIPQENEHHNDRFQKKQSLFPMPILEITVGTLLELCCGRNRI